MQGKGLQLKGTEDHTSRLSILEVVSVNLTDNRCVSLMSYQPNVQISTLSLKLSKHQLESLGALS